MDNKYTRKEMMCPLCNGYCNRDNCNCSTCIAEEDEYQIEESLKEITQSKIDFINNINNKKRRI